MFLFWNLSVFVDVFFRVNEVCRYYVILYIFKRGFFLVIFEIVNILYLNYFFWKKFFWKVLIGVIFILIYKRRIYFFCFV